MQTVLLTSMFQTQANRLGLKDEEILQIAAVIAADPAAGALIKGTGGARKLRHAAAGTGKSGGYRTIHYFGGDDVPVFLLSVFSKSEKGNLTKSERNDLALLLPQIAENYRRKR